MPDAYDTLLYCLFLEIERDPDNKDWYLAEIDRVEKRKHAHAVRNSARKRL